MTTASLTPIVAQHFARSIAATTRFFERDAAAVAACCRQMADRFVSGASLLVLGEAAQASDARHVAVEFIHPVIVGKRALPALALPEGAFDVALETLARPHDIAMGISGAGVRPATRNALASARSRGLLTVLIAGRHPSHASAADIVLEVDEAHPCVVQEVAETIYHVLWELVHVYFEHNDAHRLPAFLPPAGETRHTDLDAEVQESIRQKAQEICALRATMQQRYDTSISVAGRAVAERLRQGGRLLAFGNGGSATDADDAAADCRMPPVAGWRRLPAMALTEDSGILTAIGNDVGFDHVFSRQIIAWGGQHDVALGFSTSGASRNIVAAMCEATRRGLLTIALVGGDGGALARPAAVDHCFTAPCEHLPRIQEAHATTWHALLAVVQQEMQ